MVTINVRVSEGMKTEIEELVKGKESIWESESHLVREAINEYIKKHWGTRPRFCQRLHPKND